jgi:hypothetical protein
MMLFTQNVKETPIINCNLMLYESMGHSRAHRFGREFDFPMELSTHTHMQTLVESLTTSAVKHI